MNIVFSYSLGNKNVSTTFKDNFSNEDFSAKVLLDEKQNYKRLKVSIVPMAELEIYELKVVFHYSFKDSHKIFVNGYQSWTDSREFSVNEKLRTISKLAAPVVKKYQLDKYGDYTFKKYSRKIGDFHGYTYSYIRQGKNLELIGSLSEKSGYTIIEEKVKNNEITIYKECKGHCINSEYEAFDIILTKGSESEVFDTYFSLMNIKKPSCKPMTGWTSWYNYYQNINEDIILENLNNYKALEQKIEIFQIDDGYQTAVGDWLSIDGAKFSRGMKHIADSIKACGFKAGIWLAPFVCETNSEIFKEKKHWILKDEKGEMVFGGSNWSKFYALDIYNKEVRDYIKEVFSVVLNYWGYDMVKLDFLYAVCLVPRKDKTRGQIMTEAMEFLRECVGDKLILGCGVPLGPAFGKVDYCRIGCDVGLDWNDKPYMRLLHRERVSTLNAITNAIGRRQLNGRAFLNDPDVFLLREDNIMLTDTQRETLSRVNSIFGSLIFTSDNIKKYDDKKQLMFNHVMNLKDKVINSVEELKTGFLEVRYSVDDKYYLALINLSEFDMYYRNSFKLNEVFLDREDNASVDDNNLLVKPYECRVFILDNI
ncbi:glycoside hydrolase family 36 protein [Clostridium omnivorum]|uniref:Alpha-galactosidase n=1 Tax=Clostridium omnivorum TaxID=1604902 RepID=A0ABQ5N8S1_9CLOT|nr:glycoside hydrolase family 36 protein [Clostridium sp. E14]GLC31628.1 alpha-galactosidase [Clostridium sp. E14]